MKLCLLETIKNFCTASFHFSFLISANCMRNFYIVSHNTRHFNTLQFLNVFAPSEYTSKYTYNNDYVIPYLYILFMYKCLILRYFMLLNLITRRKQEALKKASNTNIILLALPPTLITFLLNSDKTIIFVWDTLAMHNVIFSFPYYYFIAFIIFPIKIPLDIYNCVPKIVVISVLN